MRGIILVSTLLLLANVQFNNAATTNDESDITVCPLNQTGVSYLADIYNHFGYIAFDGKELYSYDYHRPVAVYGDLDIDAYDGIAPDHPLTCTNASDIYSYGFVATGGRLTYGTNTVLKVRGNSFVDDPSAALIAPEGDSCQVYPTSESIFDFPLVYAGLMKASKYLASLKPDLHLTADGHITKLSDPGHEAYQVITLNTCSPPASGDATCSSLSEAQLSDPSGILFFGNEYEGPDPQKWPGPDDPSLYADAPTVVINIPVPNDSIMNIETGIPNTGFDACRLIFNFYPVDSNGEYYDGDDSTFTIKNNVPSSWEGFILGPRGTLDSSSSSTGGKIFFNVLIDDYKAHLLDFQCGVWGGCFPVEDIPQTTTQSSTSTTYTSPATTDDSTMTVPTTVVTSITTASTLTTTVTTTELVPTTVSVYIPVENILENEKEEDWSGKDEKWSDAKDNKWSKWNGEWSEKDEEWSKGKEGKWSKGKGGKWSEEKEGKWSEEKEGKWSGKDDKW